MTAGESTGTARAALAAGGPVGHDLLDVDWDRTPLGQPERWPRSLASIVGVLLTSRFSMWMAWGPELTFFCNDAYRRDTLGKKYPWALGRPAREVWAEIWPDIGPRIETVLRTGEATWDEALLLFLERSGVPEETYHTFSYSPLAGDDGRIEGMLCVVSRGHRAGDLRAPARDAARPLHRHLGGQHRARGARRRRARTSPPTSARCRSRSPTSTTATRSSSPRRAASATHHRGASRSAWPEQEALVDLTSRACRRVPGTRRRRRR